MAGEAERMNELEHKCITAGLKMTDQRRVILKVLADADDHPSVDTVYARARAVDPLRVDRHGVPDAQSAWTS